MQLLSIEKVMDGVTNLAERQGFEPWVPLRVHTVSNRTHSAALAPLRISGFSRRGMNRPAA